MTDHNTIAPPDTSETPTSARLIELEDRYGAHNYRPLDVVIDQSDGPRFHLIEERNVAVATQPTVAALGHLRLQLSIRPSLGVSRNPPFVIDLAMALPAASRL